MAADLLFVSVHTSVSYILLWGGGIIIFILLCLLIWRQLILGRQLRSELAMLDEMLQNNVEYEFVLKAMRLAAWHVDPKTRLVYFDNDFREFSDNYTPEAGMTIDDWMQQLMPADLPVVKKAIDDLCAGRTDIFNQQYQIRSSLPGKVCWEEAYATIGERDADGNPSKVVGASMRIDKRKEMETALIHARNKAEESDRLKTAFLANMGHEIRTPLNAIVGFADLLPVVQDEADRQQLISEIQTNNRKLLRIIDGLVSMSEIEAGARSLSRSALDLNALFQEQVASLQPTAGVPLRTHLPEEQMLIHTDREALTEIVDNLMQNAVKFTAQGKITLGYDIEGDQVRIWVQDSGKGIAPEDQERIFERFVKVDEYIPGTGLGLSVVKSHATNLGGTVGVESALGEGSRFWVLLPLN